MIANPLDPFLKHCFISRSWSLSQARKSNLEDLTAAYTVWYILPLQANKRKWEDGQMRQLSRMVPKEFLLLMYLQRPKSGIATLVTPQHKCKPFVYMQHCVLLLHVFISCMHYAFIHYQAILQKQFPLIDGWQSTLLAQIVSGKHWVTSSSLSHEVVVYPW